MISRNSLWEFGENVELHERKEKKRKETKRKEKKRKEKKKKKNARI